MIDYEKKLDELNALQKIRRLDNEESSMLSRIETYLQGVKYDFEYFIFQGGTRANTLDFCKKRNNKVFSIVELLSWKHDPDRPSLENYDPIIHLGGNKCCEDESYCYHNFGFISSDYARKLRPDIIIDDPVKRNLELDKSLKKSTIRIIEKKRAELLANADPSVENFINILLNQFANEVIGDNEKIVSEGIEMSIEKQ